MPYDRLIQIDIRGPFTRDDGDRPILGAVIESRRVWCDRIDGGTRLTTDRGGFDTQQVIVYRVRYHEPYLTNDISLIDVYDTLPFSSDTGTVTDHRPATPFSIHEVAGKRRSEIEIQCGLSL